MATFDFSNISTTNEMEYIYKYIHAYNKYLRENPGKSEAEIVSYLTSMGHSSVLLARAKELYGGVMPPLEKESTLVEEFKTYIEGKRNDLKTDYENKKKQYEDPALGPVDGKSLEDIEIEAEDARKELKKCKRGRTGLFVGFGVAALLVATAVLLPGLAAFAGGALFVPAFATNAVILGSLGGAGFLAYKASKSIFGERMEKAKETLKEYKKHQRKITRAKEAMNAAEIQLSKFNSKFNNFESIASLHSTNVNSEIDTMFNQIKTMENDAYSEFNDPANAPVEGAIGYAEAKARREKAKAQYDAIVAARAEFETLKNNGSLDLGKYQEQFKNATTAKDEYDNLHVPNIVAESEASQKAVIASVENIAEEFVRSKDDVQDIIDAGGDLANTVKEAITNAQTALTNAKFEAHAQSIDKTTEKLKETCEKKAKDAEFAYKTVVANAWKNYADNEIDGRIAGTSSLSDGEKDEYERVKGDLNSVVALINSTATDTNKRAESERYVVLAEVKSGLVRAYSDLERIRRTEPVGSSKISDLEALIATIGNDEADLLSGDITYEVASEKMKNHMKSLKAITSGERTFTVEGDVIRESDIDSRITRVVAELDSHLTVARAAYNEMPNLYGSAYESKKRERVDANIELGAKANVLKQLCDIKKSIDSSYADSAQRAKITEATDEIGKGMPDEKTFTISSLGKNVKASEIEGLIQSNLSELQKDLTDLRKADSDLAKMIGNDYDTRFTERDYVKTQINAKTAIVEELCGVAKSIESTYDDSTHQAKIAVARAAADREVPEERSFMVGGVSVKARDIDELIASTESALLSGLKKARVLTSELGKVAGSEYNTKFAERTSEIVNLDINCRFLEELLDAKKQLDATFDDAIYRTRIATVRNEIGLVMPDRTITLEGIGTIKLSELAGRVDSARNELKQKLENEKTAYVSMRKAWNEYAHTFKVEQSNAYKGSQTARDNAAAELKKAVTRFELLTQAYGSVSDEDKQLIDEAKDKAVPTFKPNGVAPKRANNAEMHATLENFKNKLVEQMAKEKEITDKLLTMEVGNTEEYKNLSKEREDSADKLRRAKKLLSNSCDKYVEMAVDKGLAEGELAEYRELLDSADERLGRFVEEEGEMPYFEAARLGQNEKATAELDAMWEEKRRGIESFIASVERYNGILAGMSVEGRTPLLKFDSDLVIILNKKLDELGKEDELRVRGLNAIKSFEKLYKESMSVAERGRLVETGKRTPEKTFAELINPDARLSSAERHVMEMMAEQGKQLVEEMKKKGEKDPVAAAAEQIAPKKKKGSEAVRNMLNMLYSVDESDVVTQKPNIEQLENELKAPQQMRKPATFEYSDSDEGAIRLDGRNSNPVVQESPLRFEPYYNPTTMAKQLLVEANNILRRIEQNMGLLSTTKEINIQLIQNNLTLITGQLGKVDKNTTAQTIERLETELETSRSAIINAIKDYNEKLNALKQNIQNVKNDLQLNAKMLQFYGVDSSVKLATLAKVESSIKILEKDKSAEGLYRVETRFKEFVEDMKSKVRKNKPKDVKLHGTKVGVKETAAKCSLEGAIQTFKAREILESRIRPVSSLGNALLETMVIRASEIILHQYGNYTVGRDNGRVIYQVFAHEDADIQEQAIIAKHKDSDVVSLDYLGDAIANSAQYIAKDEERRYKVALKKGANIEKPQGQMAIRNAIVELFNKNIGAGTGKKIILTTESGKQVARVEGGELTYGELRKLDKIIESKMRIEGGRPGGEGGSFPPQEP